MAGEWIRTGSVTIEPMRPEHADPVLAIYQAGIDTGDATFETEAPSWARFDVVFMERRSPKID